MLRQEVAAHSGSFSSINVQAANLISQPLKENFKMSIETILVVVLVVFLLGGGGWYWGRGRA